MGGQSFYKKDGGFSEYLYHQVGEAFEMNGFKCKTIDKIGGKLYHDGLPLYSNTSDIYFKKSDETGQIEQVRFYKGRQAVMDFDWGHPHGKNGEFPEGVVHVQAFDFDSKTKKLRVLPTRLMTDEEIVKFGEILKKVNPNIKFK